MRQLLTQERVENFKCSFHSFNSKWHQTIANCPKLRNLCDLSLDATCGSVSFNFRVNFDPLPVDRQTSRVFSSILGSIFSLLRQTGCKSVHLHLCVGITPGAYVTKGGGRPRLNGGARGKGFQGPRKLSKVKELMRFKSRRNMRKRQAAQRISIHQSNGPGSDPEVETSYFDQNFSELHSSATILNCVFIHHSNNRELSNKQAWGSAISFRHLQEKSQGFNEQARTVLNRNRWAKFEKSGCDIHSGTT
eukprot:sb/3468826/